MNKYRFLIVAFAAFCMAPGLKCQQYEIRMHSGGQVIHTSTADGSMTVVDGVVSLQHDSDPWTGPLASLDSLTFHAISTVGDTIRIMWSGSSATVVNPYEGNGVNVVTDGASVTAVSTLTDVVVPFILGGTSEDGSFSLRADKKVSIRLENLALTSARGAAIDISGGKKALFELVGDNHLADASTGTHKAALHSKGDIVIAGNGSLNVVGNHRHGIRTKENFYMESGYLQVEARGTVELVPVASGYEPDYSNGIKVGGVTEITGGQLIVSCPATNAGGRALSCDSNITILGGNISLSALGGCARYLDSTGTYDSYASTGIKADGDILVSGGDIAIVAGGRGLSTDGNYRQTGGTITASTSASGFGTMPYGSSSSYFSDGFAPACLKADGDIIFLGGSFSGSSTGTAGRGLRGKGELRIGDTAEGSGEPFIYVTTSGAPFLVSSSSTYWRGLPKGVKIDGDIIVNGGTLQSYCSQTSSGGGGGFPGGKQPNGEAIETKASLYISGGTVEANALDDAINAASYIQISGGRIWAYARNNDGMDCNGSRIDISGGTVIVQGSEVAIDDNGDRGGRLYITGGTIILVGGNMGTTEATPSVSGQKGITLGAGGGGNPWGGGGSSGSSVSATAGFCVKNSSGVEAITFKAPTVSGSGFATSGGTSSMGGAKPPSSGNRIYISSPQIQSGTYTYFTSPTISGGSQWHGLYSGGAVTTSGSGSSVTAQ